MRKDEAENANGYQKKACDICNQLKNYYFVPKLRLINTASSDQRMPRLINTSLV